MVKFIVGFVLGIVVSTGGFTGVIKILDKGVQEINSYISDTVK